MVSVKNKHPKPNNNNNNKDNLGAADHPESCHMDYRREGSMSSMKERQRQRQRERQREREVEEGREEKLERSKNVEMKTEF